MAIITKFIEWYSVLRMVDRYGIRPWCLEVMKGIRSHARKKPSTPPAPDDGQSEVRNGSASMLLFFADRRSSSVPTFWLTPDEKVLPPPPGKENLDAGP